MEEDVQSEGGEPRGGVAVVSEADWARYVEDLHVHDASRGPMHELGPWSSPHAVHPQVERAAAARLMRRGVYWPPSVEDADVQQASREFGLPPAVLVNLVTWHIRDHGRERGFQLRAKTPQAAQRYLQGADLLTLSRQMDLPPLELTNHVLQYVYNVRPQELKALLVVSRAKREGLNLEHLKPVEAQSMPRLSGGSAAAEAAILQSTAFASLPNPVRKALRVLQRMRRTVAITDRDVEQWEAADRASLNGVEAQHAGAAAGAWFEDVLDSFLKGRHVEFRTQNQLDREQKVRFGRVISTPDILFLQPVSLNGQPICWIDCKAFYGANVSVLRSKLRKQAEQYVRLWGPGVLLFRYGYSIALLDHMPVGSACYDVAGILPSSISIGPQETS